MRNEILVKDDVDDFNFLHFQQEDILNGRSQTKEKA